jgi:hypothetical protein
MILGPIYVGFDFPIGLAHPKRTLPRSPKIPLVSASLRCDVPTAGVSLTPKRHAAATCQWFGLQVTTATTRNLVGVL